MDIPALSMNLSTDKVMRDYNVALLSKSLDDLKKSGEEMIKMMERSVNPNLGKNIDVKV